MLEAVTKNMLRCAPAVRGDLETLKTRDDEDSQLIARRLGGESPMQAKK